MSCGDLGRIPYKREKSLVHQVTSVLLGTGMLMPGVLAGMLDHEDKGSRDSATKSWEKPGPPVMV